MQILSRFRRRTMRDMMGAVFDPEGTPLFRAEPTRGFVNSQQSSLFNFICRRLQSAAALAALTASLLVAGALGQNNPVPQIVGPVHPDAVAPGGADFTLSVYGANFVPGAVVNWNYQPRATTYISGHELQAQILSTDIAHNTAGYISVVNPAPGGANSSASWAQVEVHDPISTIIVDSPVYYDFGGWQLQAADFNHDAVLDLVDGYELDRGEGNGAFKVWSIVDWDFLSPYQFAYGDFNNDGNLDVVTPSAFGSTEGFDPTRMDVMLGNAGEPSPLGLPFSAMHKTLVMSWQAISIRMAIWI
jgi:hypothetical protein